MANILGGLLDGLFNRVDLSIKDAINSAESAGIDIVIEAGRELELAIESAKNAYEDSLNLTIDKVEAAVKETFDQLNTLVTKFETQAIDAMNDLEARAQQIVNTLPGADRQPQLINIQPRYIVLSGSVEEVWVKFYGNFVDAATVGYEPSLAFNTSMCPLRENTTQRLIFAVTPQLITPSDPSKYNYTTGILSIPWKNSGILSSSQDIATFKIGFGTLPLYPAKSIIVEYASVVTNHVVVQKLSPNFSENGNRWYPEHWHTIYEHIYPAYGWKIEQSKTPSINMVIEHGGNQNVQWGIESCSPAEIVVKISLYCGSGHDMGICHFNVTYWESQDQKQSTLRQETIDGLKWGDVKLLTPKDNEVISKLTVVTYDGKTLEFGGPDLSHFFKVAAEGSSWKIWADTPNDIESEASKKTTAVSTSSLTSAVRPVSSGPTKVDRQSPSHPQPDGGNTTNVTLLTRSAFAGATTATSPITESTSLTQSPQPRRSKDG